MISYTIIYVAFFKSILGARKPLIGLSATTIYVQCIPFRCLLLMIRLLTEPIFCFKVAKRATLVALVCKSATTHSSQALNHIIFSNRPTLYINYFTTLYVLDHFLISTSVTFNIFQNCDGIYICHSDRLFKC